MSESIGMARVVVVTRQGKDAGMRSEMYDSTADLRNEMVRRWVNDEIGAVLVDGKRDPKRRAIKHLTRRIESLANAAFRDWTGGIQEEDCA